MATEALGDERPALFLRNATGLVRGWNVRDSLIYAVLSTNFVTLGLFTFTYAGPSFPTGQLLTSVVISAILVSFLVVAYTGLITTIPRAGGDYVWQTRILGSGVGFVFAVTGWWFILWLWAPIYGNILAIQFFEPLWATLGSPSGAAWFGTNNGIFVVSLDYHRAGGRPGLDRDGRIRQDPEVVHLRRPDRVRGHRGAAADQQPRRLHCLVQPGVEQALRCEQRLRGHQRGGHQGRVPRARDGLRAARPDPAAGAEHDVLHPVAELGRQPVRRDPRRQ